MKIITLSFSQHWQEHILCPYIELSFLIFNFESSWSKTVVFIQVLRMKYNNCAELDSDVVLMIMITDESITVHFEDLTHLDYI